MSTFILQNKKIYDKNKKRVDKSKRSCYYIYRLKERASKGRMVKDHEKIRKNI